MNLITDIIKYMEPYIDIFQLIAAIIVSFIVLNIALRLIKRYLLKKVKTKKQASNITVFLDLLKYLFAFFFIIIVIAVYSENLGELGFVAGLLTVAVGWALQKPISGVVAWLIIVSRRPFNIGDRVVISDIKGDIINISLTHIFLDEVGGTIDGEEKSRRTVMIPTSHIFEKEVINYTGQDDYILDEIVTMVTYESNLENAEKIISSAVRNIMKSFWEKFPKKISMEPHNRLVFQDSGINVAVRYNTIATKRNQISTDIRREIHRSITDSNNVEFAYPHTEVLFREKSV